MKCNENATLINPHREQTQVQIQVVNEQVGTGVLTWLTSGDANRCKKPLSSAQVRYPVDSLHFKGVVGVS